MTRAEGAVLEGVTLVRRGVRVLGVVQGVGFRPFVHRVASEHGLAGWVRNTGQGVEIEVEGSVARVDAFVRRLVTDAPPMARIEALDARSLEPRGERTFAILPSGMAGGEAPQPIPPDVATCAACLAEVLDPRARRFRYPFTNCTHCGPRFTVVEALPYDRARTTLRAFPMCPACRAEYEDPADRRFHAEPIACPDCGPRLEFRGAERALGEAALLAAVSVLRTGGIVAVRGLGGFQLACDASRDDAVARLRERKHREAKPFALMAPDLEACRALCEISAGEAAVLTGPRAPIVLLQRRTDPAVRPMVAAGVAPGLPTLGLMLPATPLHHLLLREFGAPLVMTSGNRSDEPIAVSNEEALERLGGIADAFLLHDREISSRYDDSVVRVEGGEEVVLRRARGYAPEPLRFPFASPEPLLAVGAQLKSSFCLVRGERALVSQHLGDLDDALTLAHYHRTLELYRRLFRVEPRAVACDLHPDYPSGRFARSLEGATLVEVQHHHAHVVGCLAEHGFTDSVLGVAFDGTGYGTDGASWGGELLLAGWRGFRRMAHLAYLPLPGGDAAAREPWRMALAALAVAYGEEAREVAAVVLPRVPPRRRGPVLEMALRGVHAPPSSGMGRLFDAVASLAGVRDVNRFEGDAAIQLEACARGGDQGAYSLPLLHREGGAVWDAAPLIRAVVEDVRRGVDAGRIARRFHRSLADAVVEGCVWAREAAGPGTVALSGGCFQNRLLSELTRTGLERAGFRVLTHRRVPTNDGGISLGQAAVAAATLNGYPE